MDLIELRILAVSGLLTVGVVVSSLAVSVVAAASWMGRLFEAREARPAPEQVVEGHADLGTGRARC